MASVYQAMYVDSRNYESDSLEQFDGAVHDLSHAANAGKDVARAGYTAATRDVKEAVEELQRCFDSLDARMNEACFDDRRLLREWRKCSRIPGKIGRPKKRKGKQKSSDDSGSDETPPETGAAV